MARKVLAQKKGDLLEEKYLFKQIKTSNDLHEDLDLVRLKLELVVEGVRLHESAREGIGTLYKERVLTLFDTYVNYQEGAVYPAEFILPSSLESKPRVDDLGTLEDGLTVEYRNNDDSPFQLRQDGKKLVLEKDGNFITEAAFYPRPPYYSKVNTEGESLSLYVIHGGLQGLFGCLSQSWCNYYKNGDQCRFCNLVPTFKEHKKELVGRKSAQLFAEAVAAAWEDGICRRLVITGGILPGRKELDSYVDIIEALKGARNWADEDNIPIMPVIGAPEPDNHGQLKEIRDAGSHFISTNLELGHPDWFKAVCPGKHKNGGWENWVAALEHEVDIFGFGNVRSNLVAGIEPMEDTLTAVKNLTDIGVWCFLSTPWVPDAGSILEGHRNPPSEWYWDINVKLADIWQDSELTLESLSVIPGANDIVPFDIWRIWEDKTVPELGALLKNEVT